MTLVREERESRDSSEGGERESCDSSEGGMDGEG